METTQDIERRAKAGRKEAGLMLFIGAALTLWGVYGLSNDGVAIGVIMGAIGIVVAVLGAMKYSRAISLDR